MSLPILTTKLYVPPPRPKVVFRPHLLEKLNQGLQHRLSLISAPAGFGKSTLLGQWIAGCKHPVSWLSLDEADNDPKRFWTYFISALRTIEATIGKGVLTQLQSGSTPAAESLLTTLINNLGVVVTLFRQDPEQAATVWLALSTIEDGLGGALELPGGLWVLLISWAAMQRHALPRWLNYLGIAIGLAGLATVIPAFKDAGSIFGLGLILWWVWLGIVMLRGKTATVAKTNTVWAEQAA